MDDLENGEEEFETTPKRRGRPPKVKRGRGRPRRGVARTTTTTTRQEAIEPDDDAEDRDDDEEVSPIFGDEESEGISRIRVTRIEPPEGVLGYHDGKMLTERELLERWGGSVYQVQGVSALGRIVKSRTIRVAGDPIFLGSMAEMKWNKEKQRLAPSAPAVAGQGGMSVTELMAMMKEQQAAERQAEIDRREREKENDRQFAERMRLANEETERKRRLDDEEREARRRRDDEDRDRRRIQAQEESDRRQQAFMQQTVAMLQAANQQALEFVKTTVSAQPAQNSNGTLMDSIKTVLAIKEAFGGEGGGSDEPMDPMSLIARHGGEWLNGIGNAVAGGIRELKGKDAAPPLPPPPGARQLPAAQQSAPTEGGMALPPSLAPKVAELAMKIAAQGGNPETELGNIVDFLNAKLDGKQVKPPPIAGINISPAPQQPTATSAAVPATNAAQAVAAPDRLHGAVVMRFEKRPPRDRTAPPGMHTSTNVPTA